MSDSPNKVTLTSSYHDTIEVPISGNTLRYDEICAGEVILHSREADGIDRYYTFDDIQDRTIIYAETEITDI